MPPPISDIARNIFSWIAVWDRHPLKNRGFGLIYDSVRNITWLRDANYARTIGHTPTGEMTWDRAMAWVQSLSYYGTTGWRLPSALNSDGSGPCRGQNCNDSELGFFFLVETKLDMTEINVLNFDPTAIFWSSTQASETEAFAWSVYNSKQASGDKDPFSGFPPQRSLLLGPILTWPVHDGDLSMAIMRRLFSFKRSGTVTAGSG